MYVYVHNWMNMSIFMSEVWNKPQILHSSCPVPSVCDRTSHWPRISLNEVVHSRVLIIPTSHLATARHTTHHDQLSVEVAGIKPRTS